MSNDKVQAAEKAINEVVNNNSPLIYRRIPEAIAKIGSIGKNKRNQQQGFMFRGIDDVYNAVNPILAECKLFMTSEILDQQREERETKNGGRIVYTILTIRYTIWAEDGSSVTTVTVGEGMDSGDKGSNKAMSIAYKYAMFQLLCIPTEDQVDPDAEVHNDVLPKGRTAPRQTPAGSQAPAPRNTAPAAQVTQQATLPPQANTPVQKQETAEDAAKKATYVKDNVARINGLLGDPEGFQKFRKALIDRGEMTTKPSAQMTMQELEGMFRQIETEGRRLGMIKTEGDAA